MNKLVDNYDDNNASLHNYHMENIEPSCNTYIENGNSNLPSYCVDDIVSVRAFKTNMVGQIILAREWSYSAYYHIKLFTDVTASHPSSVGYKYRPHGYGDEWYEYLEGNEDGEKRIRLKIINVKGTKVNFSIKKEDISLFLQAKTDGEKFKYMLRGLWKDLVVRRVKVVKINQKPIGVWKYKMDDMGDINTDYSYKEDIVPTEIEKDTLYVPYYSNYFGFTYKFGDGDREVYFTRDNYKGMDFDINCTAWFSDMGYHRGGYDPPLKGQFVCGIVKEGEKGPYFDKWTVCSDQFFNLWKFVMSNNPNLSKNTNFDNLLNSVDTNRWTSTKLTDEQRKKVGNSWEMDQMFRLRYDSILRRSDRVHCFE